MHRCSQEGLEKLFRGPSAEAFIELMESESMWERGRREAENIAAMLQRHGVGPGARLLELGAGIGRVASHLAAMGYRVVGIDYSEKFVEKGREILAEKGITGVELLVADAYTLEGVPGLGSYDAAYMTWTTLLGYGPSPECDKQLLETLHRATRPGGLLVIASTASYDRAAFTQGLCGCRGPLLTILEKHAITEQPVLDPETNTLTNTWTIYRLDGKNLLYLDEATFKLRLYTLKELKQLAEQTGWKLEAAYHDPQHGTTYRPGTSSLNTVLRREE